MLQCGISPEIPVNDLFVRVESKLAWNSRGAIMLMLALLATVVGAALGLRFKVLVLLPAFIVGALVIVVMSIIQHSSVVSAIAVTAYVVIGLQIGYLFGVILGRSVIMHLRSYRVAWPARHIAGNSR